MIQVKSLNETAIKLSKSLAEAPQLQALPATVQDLSKVRQSNGNTLFNYTFMA